MSIRINEASINNIKEVSRIISYQVFEEKRKSCYISITEYTKNPSHNRFGCKFQQFA